MIVIRRNCCTRARVMDRNTLCNWLGYKSAVQGPLKFSSGGMKEFTKRNRYETFIARNERILFIPNSSTESVAPGRNDVMHGAGLTVGAFGCKPCHKQLASSGVEWHTDSGVCRAMGQGDSILYSYSSLAVCNQRFFIVRRLKITHFDILFGHRRSRETAAAENYSLN